MDTQHEVTIPPERREIPDPRAELINYFSEEIRKREAELRKVEDPSKVMFETGALEKMLTGGMGLKFELKHLKEYLAALETGGTLDEELKRDMRGIFSNLKEERAKELARAAEAREAVESSPLGEEYKRNKEQIDKWSKLSQETENLDKKQEYERLIKARRDENASSLLGRRFTEEKEIAQALKRFSNLEKLAEGL